MPINDDSPGAQTSRLDLVDQTGGGDVCFYRYTTLDEVGGVVSVTDLDVEGALYTVVGTVVKLVPEITLSGGGAGSNDKAAVSGADTTAGYLNDEVTVDTGSNSTNALEKSIVNPAADETLNIRLDETKLTITESQISDLTHYTHPNHSGEVTSVADGAQTVDPTAITNKTTVNALPGDFVLISDTSDSGNLKKIDASDFMSGDANDEVITVQKGSSGTIAIGKVVYITGYDTGANVTEVELSDASSSATMGAIGVARSVITQTVSGTVVTSGQLENQDTSAYAVGSDLYVSATAGDLTDVRPTGTDLIQKIGVVARSHSSMGIIEVFGAGRTNDVPNIPSNNFWLGNGSGVATATEFDTEVSANSDVVSNNSKVTNATHTGEVTGATALVVDKTALTGQTLVTATGTDHFLIADASDSSNLKKALVSDVLGGGTDANAIHGNLADEINILTEKTTPISGDWLLIEDTAGFGTKKKVQIGNLPSAADPTLEYVEISGTSTTTSTTPVNITFITLTPPSGTYIASLSCYGWGSTTTQLCSMEIAKDSTAVNLSRRQWDGNAGGQGDKLRTSIHCQCKLTANGSNVITGRFYTDKGTFSIAEVSLALIKVTP